jgi:hypothetical protein
MFFGDYVQNSEHGENPATSTYIQNCAKEAVT